MYFKKLELMGFKSFPNKTVLNFEPGITAIVGPNGCGKSNIFDSIRWVLGEQSVKALRGLNMEDVIFNGTETKEPLGLAEVSLTFSNENRTFPIEDKEFVISRRIYRSGESEYLLNKNQVRLKDIIDLFAGTGVGAESYSLVEQGKIDLILSSRPEDRRLVFDEASGITKYKAQKKEALRKLEETEANLLRINDIINEVKRQINSLERQANKARRYKEVFDELKNKEANLAIFQINNIIKEKDSLLKHTKELESMLELTQKAYSEFLTRQDAKNLESKELESQVYKAREDILNFDNLIERNSQHIRLNQERVLELQKQKEALDIQIGGIEQNLTSDNEKLQNFNLEYQSLKGLIQEKDLSLKERESQLQEILNSMKETQEKIRQAKKETFELVNLQTKVKNDIIDLSAKLQSQLAREKRLEIERSKVSEEKIDIQNTLSAAEKELTAMRADFNDKSAQHAEFKQKKDADVKDLEALKLQIQELEKEKVSLISQKEFLEDLNLKYQEISESMNALVLLDKKPTQEISGLLIKVKEQMSYNTADRPISDTAKYKLSGEAKPFSLDTKDLLEKIAEITKIIDAKKESFSKKEKEIDEFQTRIKGLEEQLREHEIALANKQSQYDSVNEQLGKINEELELIALESSQVRTEIKSLKEKESQLKNQQMGLENEQRKKETVISEGGEKITSLNSKKEENLISTAQIKTEIESLNARLIRDGDTLNMLETTLKTDKERLLEVENQIALSEEKAKTLNAEIDKLQKESQEASDNKEKTQDTQKSLSESLKQMQQEFGEDNLKIESKRHQIQNFKDEINKLQMQVQELDFKNLNIRDRIMQSYKIDLNNASHKSEILDEETAGAEIKTLKEKLDSYGTVNLMAMEEYEELKARYDFLTQQQSDLVSAKGSLHEAISKINRTTKKMFQETFAKISEEFRNYFKMLFNGGDANLFLIDESDPLESGIEIICRPPGKKLQNISMLSGGEKALSAIALIFAIFKVKPSPFCILDEVDAALDEANVDRYSRLLQEFAKTSQFIVITHNKRTIVNADVMYGITMEEQGISKIVSVKFSQNKLIQESPVEEMAST